MLLGFESRSEGLLMISSLSLVFLSIELSKDWKDPGDAVGTVSVPEKVQARSCCPYC